MQPKLNGIAVILWVRDVPRTERFYSGHLGIQFTRNPGEDGSTWLLAKIGKEVELLVFGLAEGGIDTIVASLAAAGVEIVTPVSEAPGGWSAEFKDPDGHVMAFFQDQALPRGKK